MKRIVSSVLVGIVAINATIQAAGGTSAEPKLVVGIVVDQLRTDYIEFLQSYFGDKGFRRLMKDGAYMRNVDFKVQNLDEANSTAMLFTGAYPAQTGISSSMEFNPQKGTVQPALSDPKTMGNFTNDSFSAENLRLSTLADELQIAGNGLAAIYSFAADPQQAIIMTGHAGTSACWINNTTGNWATTTYYKSLPTPVSTRNYSTPLANRIDTMQWKPSIELSRFPGVPAQKKLYPFRYTFPRSDKNVYNRFATSPLGNKEVTDVAIECLRQLRIGSNPNAIDMLNVAYTVEPYKYSSDADTRVETTDAYLRLDAQIGRLLDAVDKYVGAGNAVIWVSSTGYCDEAVVEDKKYRIPGGDFSMKRAKSLLNSYLSALHGNADYITAFYDNHLYLDHKVLEDKKLDVSEVVSDARTFLTKMSGVADAYTLHDILSPSTPEEENLRLALDPKTGGDIILKFSPGWNVVNDLEYPTTSKSVRQSPVLTPAFIMAPGLAAQTVSAPVDAVAIAPTISGILRIRSPNGSQEKPLAF